MGSSQCGKSVSILPEAARAHQTSSGSLRRLRRAELRVPGAKELAQVTSTQVFTDVAVEVLHRVPQREVGNVPVDGLLRHADEFVNRVGLVPGTVKRQHQ